VPLEDADGPVALRGIPDEQQLHGDFRLDKLCPADLTTVSVFHPT